jgi:hypothetical protein
MMHYFQDMKLFCAGALLPAALLFGAAPRTEPALPPRVVDSYGKLPLSFEANRGQTARQVKFLARGPGYTLFLTPDAAVLSLHRQKANVVLRMRLQGANARASVTGADALPGKSNYFIGSDPSQWRTDVPTYAGVKYAAVYPGIDLVYHGNQRLLEYDFLVAPGADPRAIGIRFQGARKLTVNRDGALVIGLGGSEVIEPAPVVYQEVGGRRQTVAGRYVLRGKGRVGFSVAEYDRSRPLVIDPVLVYSTYLGGSGNDDGTAIAVDTSGNAYVTGSTSSTNFPTTPGAFQTTNGGGTNDYDAFVTKLNATGSALVYSTYLGGAGRNPGLAIAVDASGNAYVTGFTNGSFPVTQGAFQTTFGAGGFNAFVSKLSATGSALLYSTYLGGSVYDEGCGIAVDASGNAYVTGVASSPDFPTTPGALQTSYGGMQDAFVTKLNAAGSALVYSTYLGGSDYDWGRGIAADASGNAYVIGSTQSSNFPTTAGAFQTILSGEGNAFVSKLSPTGTALIYSTYLGGGGDFGSGGGIAVDVSGNAYLTGATDSSSFPTTPGAFQTTSGGWKDAFVTELNATGSALVYSTYLGGSSSDYGNGITVDPWGDAYIIGITYSSDFPTTPGAVQTTFGGVFDAFVSKLNADGSALLYSTYLGGNNHDWGFGTALDASGNAYVTGCTDSSDFPTTPSAFQTTYGGQEDAYVSKLSLGSSGSPPVTTANLNGPPGNNGWYLGAVTVTLVATPGNSPISATYYSIDSGPYQGYGAPFAISTDGIHQLLFYSVDTAGDQEVPHGQTIKIDAKPVSHVSALPATATTPNFNVQWSGTDATSGLANYTIYVSDNGGPFAPWLSQVTSTQAYYTGSLLHTYGFYSIAQDVAGNVESPKTAAEATTHVPQMPGDVNGDGKINCADIALVKAAFGTRTGQPGFNPRADVNHDGVVNVMDLAIVSQKLAPGTKCP